MESYESQFVSEDLLDFLLGQRCWGISAGEGTGSIFQLHLGEKRPRRRPLRNTALEEDVRNFEGIYCIRIECSWRLTSPQKWICTSQSPNCKDGEMITGLKHLVGASVSEIGIDGQYLDLTIRFNELCLSVFNDEPNPEQDAYTIYSLHEAISAQQTRFIVTPIGDRGTIA